MAPLLVLEFAGEVIAWRGPAPFVFVAIPAEHDEALRAAARAASYGWGVIPVEAGIGGLSFTTSLFPRGGHYLLPLKVKVRRAIEVEIGATARVRLTVHAAHG